MTGIATVLIVAYLLIVIALIAVILLQRSEGGALGIGGGSNQFMTARGSANLLTRTTAILATLFFAMAIGLTILAELDRGSQSILDRAQQTTEGGDASQPTSVLDALNQLQGDTTGTPAAPAAPPATDTPNLAVPAAPAADATAPAAPAAETTAPAPAAETTAPATPAAPSTDAAPAATPAEPATNGGGQTTTN